MSWRWLKYGLIIPLILFLLVLAIGTYFLATKGGSATLINMASNALPALTMEGADGDLLDELTLKRIVWEKDDVEVEVTDAVLEASTFPPRITIENLAAKLITITLPEKDKAEERKPFELVIPDINIPIDVDLKNVSVEEMHIKQGDALFKLRDVKLSALVEDDTLNLRSLFGDLYDDHGNITVTANGDLGLSNPHPIALDILIDGDSKRLGVGTLNLLAQGDVLDYQLTSSGNWKYADYPEYQLSFAAAGDLEYLNVSKLHLQGDAGDVDLVGRLSWSPELNWDMELTGDRLNPGKFLEEYPGQLNMVWQTTGKLTDTVSVDLELKHLTGNLQDYPIDARMKLSVEDEVVTLKELDAKVGDNHLSAEGEANNALNINWQLDAANLAQLHPSISGRLKGNGQLSGKRDGSQFSLIIESLKGKVLDYSVDARGGLQLDDQIISANDLQLNVGDNKIHLNGTADENQGIDWQINAKKLSQLYPEIKGKLKGEGNVKGLLDGSFAELQIDSLDGKVQGFPLTAEGHAKWQNEIISVDDLRVNVGKNKVTLNGTSEEDQGIDWQIDAKKLSQLHPDITGKIKGQGNVKGLLDGSRAELHIEKLDGKIQGFPLAAEGDAKWQDEIITLDGVRVNVGKNKLMLNGNSAEDLGIEWAIDAQNLHQLYPKIKGNIKGSGQLSGELDGSSYKLNIAKLNGKIDGRPLSAKGQVVSENGKISLQRLSLQAGKNKLNANGQASEPFDLSWDINAPALAKVWPGLGGSIKGKGSLSGSLEKPQFKADLTGKKIRYEDIRIGALDLKADQKGEIYTIKAKLKNIKQGENIIQRVVIDAKGKLENHVADLDVTHKEGRLKLKAAGGWKQEQWKGKLRKLSLNKTQAGNWRLQKPVSIKASAKAVSTSTFCLASDKKAQLCSDVAWSEKQGVSAKGKLKSVPLMMAKPWLPDNLNMPGQVNGEFDISQRNGKPKGTVNIRLPDSSVTITNEKGRKETLRYSNAMAKITMDGKKAKMKATLDLKGRGKLRADGDIILASDNNKSRINARATIDVPDIHWVQQFSNDIDELKGKFAGEVKITGTLGKPRVTGSAKLQNASVFLPDTGATLQAIQFNIQAKRADQMVITGSLKAGEGTLKANGNLYLANLPKWRADLKLSGKRLLLMDTHEVQAYVSPNLTINAKPESVTINGVVKVPETTISLRELPVTAKSRSDDIVIVGRGKKGQKGRAIPRSDKDDAVLDIRPNVVIELGKKVNFRGFGLDAGLSGRLRILRTRQDIVAQGALNVIDGIYKAYGQELEIEKGRLIFDGPIDNPGLNVRVVRNIPGEIKVGIALRGTAQAPESELFSSPPQTQTDTLSYLLTGHSIAAVSSGDSAMLTQAVAGLGIKGGEGLAQKLGSDLGLDEVGLNAKDGNYKNSELTLGKRIGTKLYIKYIVGLFDSMQKVAVTYQINKRLQLNARTGTQQEVDLDYKFDTDKGIFGR